MFTGRFAKLIIASVIVVAIQDEYIKPKGVVVVVVDERVVSHTAIVT